MIVDTSALVAIAINEPERDAFSQAITQASSRRISAANVVELVSVIAGRWPDLDAAATASRLLDQLKVEIVQVDAEHAWAAGVALIRYGRGRHPARLNYGDSFAYATAKLSNQPLLFKGNDFSQTDIEPAL
ncbi:MAG: ribonuclease [Caulobacter sp.]|nr:ribonuclease [Caulobacter sp.]